ncbi:MAG: hypothetical protein MK102_09065 [Fuerstiella sp.]|nr:hypothetical protein [Fuerstiella sp.]
MSDRLNNFFVVALLLTCGGIAHAQTSNPAASYIFPAGAQRGQTVEFMVGGLFLLNDPWFEISGTSVQVPERLRTGQTVWFDGQLLTGQRALGPDEYPKDHQGVATIAGDAPIGAQHWRVWTSQGASASRVFIIGDLPEVVEREIDGDPVSVSIDVPVTANGRIFPRSDLDIWTFEARRGEIYTIEMNSKSLGSPLDGRIAVYAAGKLIADDIGSQSTDPVIQFQAESDGPHEIHVHDVGYAGTQACVYRLTVRPGLRTSWVYPLGGRRGTSTEFEVGLLPGADGSEVHRISVALEPGAAQDGYLRQPFTIDGRSTEPVRLEINDVPERLEEEPNNTVSETAPMVGPVVLNGRVDHPGDVDLWPVAAMADGYLELRLSAGRYGSHLQPDLEVLDRDGNVLAPNDTQPVKEDTVSSDRLLVFKPEQDGVFWLRVRDRFSTRGGPAFGYRLQVGSPTPGFHLSFDKDAVTAVRGNEVSLPVHIERYGGLTGPVAIEVSGLPQDTEAGDLLIPAGKDEIAIRLKPSETAPIGGHRLQVRGTHTSGDRTITRLAIRAPSNTDTPVDSVLFSVAVATPFKFKNRGPYFAFANAGTVYWHPFTVERNGYDGPVTVRLADRQRRHLQGIRNAREFVVAAGISEFEFPFFLPPNMSRDSLRRCLVMGIGQIEDEKGNRHQVVFTDGEESQAPIHVQAPRLNIVSKLTSVYVQPDSTNEIEFEIQRGANLDLPVTVELIVPTHIDGLHVNPVIVPRDQHTGWILLEVGQDAGPVNMPLTLRATILENGDPVIGESTVTIVTASPNGELLTSQLRASSASGTE